MEAVLNKSESEMADSDFVRRRWYHRRDLRFLALVAVFIAIFHSYGYITGPAKISSELANLMEQSKGRVNIEIESNFPPESFHISIYQKLGSMRGSKGNVTTIHRIFPNDVVVLSRKYWVKEIRPAPPIKR